MLTAFSVGLGVSLVIAVLVIHSVVDQSFHRGGEGYSVIVGPKGDKLQLLMSSVYYLGGQDANLPYEYYRDYYADPIKGEVSSFIDEAIPIAMGHFYSGYRVVATTPGFFERLRYRDELPYRFALGENFKSDEPFQAVVGAMVARKTGLRLTSTFKATCGSVELPGEVHQQEFTIVGVLEPTGTPVDRALFVNLKGFWKLHNIKPPAESLLDGSEEEEPASSPAPETVEATITETTTEEADHEHEDADEHETVDASDEHSSAEVTHDESDEEHAHEETEDDANKHPAGCGCPAHAKELSEDPKDHPEECDCPFHSDQVPAISAILLVTDGMYAPTVAKMINQGPHAQAVIPSDEITKFFDGVIGNVQLVLLILAVMTVVVAGIGIMVSIYNSMSERRHEIAIMRALGASRTTVMLVILLESILLSLGGGLIGLILGHGLIWILAPTIMDNTGVIVHALQFRTIELVLIPGLITMATLVGYLPALVAYRTDVARSLTRNP